MKSTQKNEMYMAKNFALGTQHDLYATYSCGGLALGVMQMLVFPMRNCGTGGLSRREDPTRMVLRRSRI